LEDGYINKALNFKNQTNFKNNLTPKAKREKEKEKEKERIM